MKSRHAAAFFAVISLVAAGAAPEADKLIGKEAGQSRRDNGLKMVVVWCPPGRVVPDGESQGLEMSAGFWIGRHEVTQREFYEIMGTAPWLDMPRVVTDDDNIAATHICWNDAREFCRKLTETDRRAARLPATWEYTLPTEELWEYACGAGSTTLFCFGDDDKVLGEYAWFSPRRQSTLPGYVRRFGEYPLSIGQKKPNAWKIYDMHGNVWEWCRDGYADVQPRGRDPESPANDVGHVIRGGSWWNGAMECRSARRDRQAPDHTDFTLGFRVALVRTP